MNELLDNITENIMDYFYNVIDDDGVTYNQDADCLLAILDGISAIEEMTYLPNVCDVMRGDVIDVGRGDNLEVALAMQGLLQTIRDLRACNKAMEAFASITKNWRRGIITTNEALRDYSEVCLDCLGVSRTFAILSTPQNYSFADMWQMMHTKEEVM